MVLEQAQQTVDLLTEQENKTLRKKRIFRFVVVGLVVLLFLAMCGGAAYGFSYLMKQQAALAATIQAQAGSVSSLEQELETKKSEYDDLKQQNETLQSENKALEESNKSLEDKNKNLQSENSSLKVLISNKNKTSTKAPSTQSLSLQAFAPSAEYANKKLVALTFDDGPGAYTGRLLDILKSHGVKATFFLQGRNAARYPDLIKRMDKEGHAIGNHSYSHAYLPNLSAASVAAELEKCNAVIRKAVGYNAVVMRTPYGAGNATVKKAVMNAKMPIVLWSVDSLDWKSRNKTAILNTVFNQQGVKDGSIILLHDIHKTTVDAMDSMITRLKKEGFTLVTVPQLLAARKNGGKIGETYYHGYK